MLHSFYFTETTPFLRFLEEHKEKWHGQPILNFYSDVPFAQFTKTAFVLELRSFCVVVEYPCHSDLTLHIIDKESLQKDPSLGFLYKDRPAKKPGAPLSPCPFLCLGHCLSEIKPNRYSYSTRPRISGNRTLPEGQDYFNFISISLDTGRKLIVHSTDAWCGDFFRIRDDPCSFEIMALSPPVSRHAEIMHTIESDFGEGFDFSERRISIPKFSLKMYPTGTATLLPTEYHGCDVTVFTRGFYPTTVLLCKSIPTFDSSDRQYDSWHKLYLARNALGKIHAVYVTGGYEIARIEGFAQVNAYPEALRPYLQP